MHQAEGVAHALGWEGLEHHAFAELQPKPKGNAQRIAKNKATGALFVATDGAVKRRQRDLAKLLTLLAPPRPLRGAVVVDVVFYLPIPTTWPQWRQEAAARGLVLPYTESTGSTGGIPDRGNLLKLLEDCLELGGWLANDSQVCWGNVGKRHGRRVGYEVRAREVFEVASFKAWQALLEAVGGADALPAAR